MIKNKMINEKIIKLKDGIDEIQDSLKYYDYAYLTDLVEELEKSILEKDLIEYTLQKVEDEKNKESFKVLKKRYESEDVIKDTLKKVEDERQKESHEVLQGKKTGSMVNHPDHYQGKKYEVIDIIEDFNLNFSLGSAVKYILRAGKKDDKNQDLEKAIWYLKRELKIE